MESGTALGTNAAAAKAVARAMPNPSTGVFELTTASPLISADVFNVRGAQVLPLLPVAGQAKRLRCDLSAVPAGVYPAQLQTAAGLQTLKLVKN